MNDPLLIDAVRILIRSAGAATRCAPCIGVDPGIALISERLQAQ